VDGLLAAAAVCALCGCSGSGEPRARQIGEAYAAPGSLKIRQDVDPRSAEVATVQHGDRLAIIGRRRRFIKVRTARGREGWTDIRQLLSTAQMLALDKLAERARTLPSQGAASVYEAVNVHTEPNRMAPSFHRLKEKDLVDVVTEQLMPRTPFDSTSVLPPPAPPKPKPQKKPESGGRTPPPPMPRAPGLPAGWLELSKTARTDAAGSATPAAPPEPVPATPVDEWALVRLGNGRAGWVLTGMLRMNIPDEVAQYSEGHRISSYFAMGDVNDGGQIKHNWLWTTMGGQRQPYQFDSLRYFVWNARRHRYETAYIERNLKGRLPLDVHPVNVKGAAVPGFSIIVEDSAGVPWRKTYSCQAYRVALVGKAKWQPAPPETPPPALTAEIPEPTGEKPGAWARITQTLAGWKQRWFGK